VCGIAGKLTWSGPPDRQLLERMCDAVEHRGPDSRGVFLDNCIGLGVQRLAVIDLETGDQPIFNEDRSVVVVLNGEIYNYLELREGLARRGHRFSTRSDTEVIAHLYEDHGDDCVEHLRGMFAFALWDRRRRRLLLARDRVGKKPLFYCHIGEHLWFASEPRAILRDEAVPREINAGAIDSFLHYQYVPSPESAFAALRKLQPAHVLTCERGRLATRRYWKLSYESRLAGTGEHELCELVRERLLEATKLRLRSDVPLGAFLSGGIDSSAVVAAAARLSGAQLKTFSIGFDVEHFDESRHARAVAELYGTDHFEQSVDPSAMRVLPRLVWHYGEPFADQSAVPTFHLAELARGQVTVALNGDGGDESFAGYRRYLKMMSARRGVRRVRPVARYARLFACFRDQERADLYHRDFLARVGEQASLRVVERPYLASDATTLIERLLDVDVHTYLPDDLLVKMDIATMAHSLEARSPLLDHVFMETIAALPADAKLGGGEPKRLFRAALRDWLPPYTLDRPKMGFGVPLDEWFRGGLRDLPAEVLLDRRSTERGMFRRERVEELIRDHLRGAADHGKKLWTLLQFEVWLRTYIDGPAVEPLTMSIAEPPAPRPRAAPVSHRPAAGPGLPHPRLVSVIMPVMNEEAHVGKQMAALAFQTYDRPWELVVVDNGSRDGSAEIVQEWRERMPWLRIENAAARRGINYARNVGARAARGDFLAFCDADDVVTPGWLAAMAEAATHGHIVAGAFDLDTLNEGRARAMCPWQPPGGLPSGHRFLPYAPGGNCGIWTHVVRELGGWDESFRFGSSDLEFSWRAQLASYRLSFASEAVLQQRLESDAGGLARQYYAYGKSDAQLYRRFRDAGMPRPGAHGDGAPWRWIVTHAPYLLISPRRRGQWIRQAARRAGRVVGSARHRVVVV